MIKADNHVYSKFSLDSRLELKDIAKKAKEKGISYVALTDKVRFSTQPVKEAIYRISNRNEKIDKIGKNNGIRFIKAIEVDEPHLYQEELKMLCDATEIDYVLGTIHQILGIPVKKMVTNPAVVDLYIKSLYQMVEEADIDAVGHLDYLKKFITDPHFDNAILCDILDKMIERNIALEINSSPLRRNSDVYPSRDIITQYKMLGGDKVIYGSGAHQINEIYDGIDKIKDGLEDLELEEYIVLERKAKRI